MKVFFLETVGEGALPEAYRRAAQAQLEVDLSERVAAPGTEALFLAEAETGSPCPVLHFRGLSGELVVLPETAALAGRLCWSCNGHCRGGEGLTPADVSPARCAVRFWLELAPELQAAAGDKKSAR